MVTISHKILSTAWLSIYSSFAPYHALHLPSAFVSTSLSS